jgi:hypothetical protein
VAAMSPDRSRLVIAAVSLANLLVRPAAYRQPSPMQSFGDRGKELASRLPKSLMRVPNASF